MNRLITGVTLIDGTGGPPVEQAAVCMAENRITAVGRHAEVNPSSGPVEHWHLPGLTLLPGLIDAHVHILVDPDPAADFSHIPCSELFALYGARHARQTLEAGFTMARDVGAVNETIFALRQAIAEGSIPGPRIVASGKCITITGGHGAEYGVPMAWEVNGAEELRKAVRAQLKVKADLIKLIATRSMLMPPYHGGPAFTVEEMQPGIADAHAAGFLVAAHAHTNVEGIRNAVLAGTDTLEHGSPADDQSLDVMAQRGSLLVPTVAVWMAMTQLSADDRSPSGERMAEIAPRRLEAAVDTVRRAKVRGVRIALGTDAGNPGVQQGGNAWELELLTDAGLSSMEAIVAATQNAAQACGRGDVLGTIEVGKLADCIVVEGDPLRDISLLRDRERIRLVIQDGKVVVNRGLGPTVGE